MVLPRGNRQRPWREGLGVLTRNGGSAVRRGAAWLGVGHGFVLGARRLVSRGLRFRLAGLVARSSG